MTGAAWGGRRRGGGGVGGCADDFARSENIYPNLSTSTLYFFLGEILEPVC